jgi:hypothetical protein
MTTTPTTTYISALIKCYSQTEVNGKTLDTRLAHFEKLASTGVPICLFVDADYVDAIRPLLTKYPNIQMDPPLRLEDTWTYSALAPYKDCLPPVRNQTKDTFEFLALMIAKSELVAKIAERNPFNTPQFAWIDFNVFHVVQNPPIMMEHLKMYTHLTLANDTVIIPGCWHKGAYSDRLWNQINWRFCGGFYLGTRNAVLTMQQMLQTLLPTWLADKKAITWEVNLWSHLENTTGWSPTWFAADHNDRLLTLSREHFHEPVTPMNCIPAILDQMPGACSNADQLPMMPEHPPYKSTSSSYLRHKGADLLHTRYVNYELTPEGAYIVHHPQRWLHTRNFVFALDSATLARIGDGREITGPFGIATHCNEIQGLEDIRLYEYEDKLKFIATQRQFSPSQQNRMMIGELDLATHTYKNAQLIEPPTPTYCEKNWIPLPESGKEAFIYGWNPYRLGQIETVGGVHRLSIFLEKQLPPFFERIRGSTVCQAYEGKLYCVVHYSKEGSPRNYYHALVEINRTTCLPIRYSQPFAFRRIGIEFCIGFCFEPATPGHVRFWCSQHDRDPVWVSLPFDHFEWNNINYV